MSKSALLSLLILLGLIAGVLVGHYVLYSPARIDDSLRRTGELMLIRPLMLLVIPLVFVSVVVGVARIGDAGRLGLVGGATIVYFFATMLLAAGAGVALATLIPPGQSLTAEEIGALRERGEAELAANPDLQQRVAQPSGQDLSTAWMEMVDQLLPRNIVAETTQTRPLGLIIFAALLGLALAAGGDAMRPAVRVFEALLDAILRIVRWIAWLAPIGVLLLVAWTVGTIGLEPFSGPLSRYMLVIIGGLAIHGFVVLPIILLVLGRANPYRFLWQMRKALLTALGTASSAATLPVTIETAIDHGNCSKRAATVVIPLGGALNMNGTALFEAAAVVFLFQIHGIELQFGQLLIVVITATLAAARTEGIPSAALLTMLIVIAAVNTSLAGSGQHLPAEAIGLVIGVDRMLDMCRTAINVWGDAVGAKIMSKLAPDASEAAAAVQVAAQS